MATFLFDKIIFGPVFSRRLGVSLGINLLPRGRKICNFDCIYCECGSTQSNELEDESLPSRDMVKNALYQTLEDMAANDQDPDVITFAGNGEPTIHPDFPGIIDDTIEVKNVFFPEAEIAVLCNSTTLHIPEVKEALSKVDKPILKLDSAISQTIQLHNRPSKEIDATVLVKQLAELDFNIIIQTMFIKGEYNNIMIDNTSEEEISAWLKALEQILPSEVQIYTISRDVPAGNNIQKIPLETLNEIAGRVKDLGINTQVSG